MADGELNDDEQQPAPLPAHERVWRHPSEVGHRQWALSEPPLFIGRGLAATTGAIGVMLAFALLWTMMPTEAGRTAVISVRSTVAALIDSATSATTGTTAEDPRPVAPAADNSAVVSESLLLPTTTLRPVSPSIEQPMVTYAVQQTSTVAAGAVAVAIGGGSLAITTAYAVEADATVEVLLTDGSVGTARVLFVDDTSGLAVLAMESVFAGLAFTVAEIAPGDELTTAGDVASTFTAGADGEVDSAALVENEALREGTPLMNKDGELVGLCSQGHGGEVVALADFDQLQSAAAGWSGVVWLGIVLDTDSSGVLVVEEVDPYGPSAAAGLQPGDIILAVEGVPVTSGLTIVEARSGFKSGDDVEITVRRDTSVTITVVVWPKLVVPHGQ
ncbi:MAG: PDZ domain-containing protein [Actinobacteria bacterium]|nr:PDZ domain-containing protein [Actinomycetota bacterium]